MQRLEKRLAALEAKHAESESEGGSEAGAGSGSGDGAGSGEGSGDGSGSAVDAVEASINEVEGNGVGGEAGCECSDGGCPAGKGPCKDWSKPKMVERGTMPKTPEEEQQEQDQAGGEVKVQMVPTLTEQ